MAPEKTSKLYVQGEESMIWIPSDMKAGKSFPKRNVKVNPTSNFQAK